MKNEPKKRVPQSKAEIEQQLVEQINFLISSASLYDQGHHYEAKRIALGLRILFHDTRTSKSLLGQLKLKKRTAWLDTAKPYNPKNLTSHVGLVAIRFENPTGRIPWLVPIGIPERKIRNIAFDKWWGNAVLVAVEKEKRRFFSRQNLILNLANTDGGGHVDPGLDPDYRDLSRGNIIGYTAIQNGEEYPMLNPELPAVRQISHEVLVTLQQLAPQYFQNRYEEKVQSGPYGISKKTGPPSECEVRIHVNW